MSDWERPGVDLSFSSSSSSPDDITSNLDEVEDAACGSTEPVAAFSDECVSPFVFVEFCASLRTCFWWLCGCLASGSELFGLAGVWLVEWEPVEFCLRGCPYIRYQRKLWITRRRCILGWKPKVFPNPRTIKTRQRTKQWIGDKDSEERKKDLEDSNTVHIQSKRHKDIKQQSGWSCRIWKIYSNCELKFKIHLMIPLMFLDTRFPRI